MNHDCENQVRPEGQGPRFLSRPRVGLPLAVIKSEDHLEAAQAVLDRLLAKGDLDDGEQMYLDALSDLVACYEDEHHPIAPASDADMLRHLMEAKGVSQTKVSRETGIAKSTDLRSARRQKAVQPPDDSQTRRVFQGGRHSFGSQSLTPDPRTTHERRFQAPTAR